MLDNGRLYHPAPLGDYGLLASPLTIELGKIMEFGDTQTLFHWQGKAYPVNADPALLGAAGI